MLSVSVCVFANSSQETGVRLFPHSIKLLWDSPVLVSSFFFSFLPQFKDSVTFAVELCSLMFYSLFFSRKSLLKEIHIQVWTLVYVFKNTLCFHETLKFGLGGFIL